MYDVLKRIYYKLVRIFSSFHPIKWGYIGDKAQVISPDIVSYPEKIIIGEETTILNHARLQVYQDLAGEDCKIIFGKRCYCCYYLTILAGADVIIHDDVLFASFVLISTENHGIDPESEISYMDQPLRCAPVEIGEGCWIGEKVTILPGVTIGKRCVIGANSVVTHDIPDYSIAVGSPAVVIKRYDFKEHRWVKG